ncbi:hypothetical protein B723_27995 [Pseudomonas fluorescens NCIMB 11764]|uniref:Uncharacterized protein n=1 Tax=Pseudomonas fluorescens NCIMB 11764 TaxID=1221522 RepID=A0A0K1QWJ8_PSEFL|nr:hypothetical protein [Pseudomonas fluorescens]AKV10037.1 hypothetical protein B723_27995 [Pseudomonas fluorescens NCIMB 11764]
MQTVEQDVFFGPVFNKVRNSFLLRDKRILAVGSFSLVFEGSNPDTVYHLSIDNASHDFALKARAYAVDGVARIHKDYGAVGIYHHDKFYSDYLWLAEMELLLPITTDSMSCEDVRDVLLSLTDSPEGNIYTTYSEKCKFLAQVNRAPFYPRTMRCVESLRRLIFRYVATSTCDLDVRLNKFMIRPYSGEVVLNGPVNWMNDVSQSRHAQLIKEVVVLKLGWASSDAEPVSVNSAGRCN